VNLNDTFGMAISDIVGARAGSTLRVRAVTSISVELPVMADGDSARPAASPLTLTVSVDASSLPAGLSETDTRIVVCRWTSAARVPGDARDLQYCADDDDVDRAWIVSVNGTRRTGVLWSFQETLLSSEQRAYRASIYIGPRPESGWRTYYTFLIAAAFVAIAAALFYWVRKRAADTNGAAGDSILLSAQAEQVGSYTSVDEQRVPHFAPMNERQNPAATV
jgi:hypothetical protein